MPVPRFTYDVIKAVYGEPFARLWFRPVSITERPTL